MARVYVRSITRSTMYQNAPFCELELAYGKLVLLFCSMWVQLYSDYLKSLSSRIHDVYVFFNKVSQKRYFIEKKTT